MDYVEAVEGATRLRVPSGGGISRREEVFYNPHMTLSRDLTVALCRLFKPASFLDAMAGSGARGIRVAHEAGVDVTLNDLNPKAVGLIRENAALNGVEVTVASRDARTLLAEGRYDYVDVDPFGTPAGYVDAAVSSLKSGGILGVCATDTSALCGTYPRACLRKYDALPLRCDCLDEIGLRVLMGYVARAAVRHYKGVEPLICHSTRHYMRVQARLTRRHNTTLSQLAHLQYCFKCLWRGYRKLDQLERKCSCGGGLKTAGPLWAGPYADKGLCQRMTEELAGGAYGRKAEAVKLVERVAAEQDILLPYYDLHKLSSVAGVEALRMDCLFAKAKAEGFSSARTHFNHTGFRCDMPADKLLGLLKQ